MIELRISVNETRSWCPDLANVPRPSSSADGRTAFSRNRPFCLRKVPDMTSYGLG